MERVALVTGATDGLGRGVAERLAAAGLTVHLHGRDAGKLERTAAEIAEATGNERLVQHRADFASLAQVRALVGEVEGSTEALHVLVSNAGIGSGKPDLTTRQESEDGYELRFAVNYLAGFLLTRLLEPLLVAAAPGARIVNVASAGQWPIDFDDVMLERSYDGQRAYAQSKLAQVMSTFDLAERLRDAGVTVNALHPSTYMPTKIVHSPVSTVADGVRATSRLIWDLPREQVNGQYFNVERAARAHAQAYDVDARARLRRLSAELTGSHAAGSPA